MYTQPQPDLIKGSLYSITAFFFFALVGLFLKGASLYGASSFSATFMVYVAATLFSTPYVIAKGTRSLATGHFFYHLSRAGYGIIAMLLYAYAMRYIPVMNATLLFNTAPLFIPIFGMFLLNAKVALSDWLTILVGFIGIVCVIDPKASTLDNPADILGLFSGAFLALAFIYIKKLNVTEPAYRIVYYFFLLSTLMMLPFALANLTTPSWQSLLMAILAAISLIIMQLSLTMAYSYAKPSKIGIFQYTTIIFVGLIEWFLWDKHPSPLEFLGFLLIASSGSTIIAKSK
jgi:drug/metabolite transporter (DMT)-like permease